MEVDEDSLHDRLVRSQGENEEEEESTGEETRASSILDAHLDMHLVDTLPLYESEESNLCQLISLSLPVVLSNVLSFVMSLMSLAFIGRMIPGESSLAASILATTLFNATGLSLLSGCLSALETLSGNAYGMKRYETVGHVLLKSLALDAVLCWSIIMFWMYSVESLLGAYVGEEMYVSMACRYLRMISPALPMYAIFESLRRYLGCQKIVRPVTWSNIIGFVSCPMYNVVLIGKYGLDGAALAQVFIVLTQTVALVTMTVIIDMNKSPNMPKTWTGISWEALTHVEGYYEFLHLAIPGLFMTLSEWWAFEVLVVLAGMLPTGDPNVFVSAMGVIVQISGLVWTIVSGVCFAGSILISTSLGHGKPEHALAHSRELFKVTSLIEMCMAFFLVMVRNHIGRLFSSSESVATCVATAIPIFALTLIPDGINIPIQNILKACGKQKLGALLNVLYWAVIPLGVILGKEFLLNGLWFSILTVNIVLCMALSLSYSLVINFEQESDNAAMRVEAIETNTLHST